PMPHLQEDRSEDQPAIFLLTPHEESGGKPEKAYREGPSQRGEKFRVVPRLGSRLSGLVEGWSRPSGDPRAPGSELTSASRGAARGWSRRASTGTGSGPTWRRVPGRPGTRPTAAACRAGHESPGPHPSR